MWWTVPKCWPEETVFVVGGGPSLAGFDVEQLRGRRLIVINRASIMIDTERRNFLHPQFDAQKIAWPGIPWADVLYFADDSWWTNDGRAVRASWQGTYIVTIARVGRPYRSPDHAAGILRLENGGAEGLSRDPRRIRHGTNSGHQAINLAFHFGARRIVLLGFDQKTNGTQTHAHGGYRGGTVTEQHYAATQSHVFKTMHTPYFNRIARELQNEGVEVLNACPDSALECWPKITLNEAVRL